MAVNEAVLNYGKPKPGVRPAYYLYPAPPGAEGEAPGIEPHVVHLVDGRRAGPFLLDREGFDLVRHRTAMLDFYDDAAVRAVYFAEVEALVRSITGAREVYAFDHNLRAAHKAGQRGIQKPVRSAHNDYTERSAPQRVRDLWPERADALLARRYAIINVWRPIAGPVRRSPLAVCDAGTMAPEDFVLTDLRYRDRTGEVATIRHNPRHRWFYFPSMDTDEVLLLKCFDSDTTVDARFTAHSAVDLLDGDPDAPERESIEVRTFAFFD